MANLYRHFDENGVLLYVGISTSALKRLGEHERSAGWFKRIVKVTIVNFPTREAAADAELRAIKTEFPLHNVLHKIKEKEIVYETRMLANHKPALDRWIESNGVGSFADFVSFARS